MSDPRNEPVETEDVTDADRSQDEVRAAADGSESGTDDRLRDLENELAQAKESILRKHAEFDNYRKRVERERQELIAYAAAEIVKEILPVVDNLDRAVSATAETAADRLREGVEIIHRQFHDVLRKAGLKEVPGADSRFDPHVHEAVDRVETREREEGTVVEVLQKGYFLKERLLRPALVRVAKNPDGEHPADDPDHAASADAPDPAEASRQPDFEE